MAVPLALLGTAIGPPFRSDGKWLWGTCRNCIRFLCCPTCHVFLSECCPCPKITELAHERTPAGWLCPLGRKEATLVRDQDVFPLRFTEHLS